MEPHQGSEGSSPALTNTDGLAGKMTPEDIFKARQIARERKPKT